MHSRHGYGWPVRGRRSLVGALVAFAALGVAPWAAGPAPAAAPDPTPDALAITLDSLAPGYVPEKGPITVSGTVTNTTEETWTDVNVYPLTSRTDPMTTQAELAAAVDANPDLPVGERILEVSDSIGDLAPGEQAPYDLRVPRRLLGIVGTPGVYWFGVHALGANAEGRDDQADGKARTFVPLIGDDDGTQEVALVVQLRRRIAYAADGTLGNPERWREDLSPGGRLFDLLEIGATSGGRPLTYVFDPALLGVANALAAGDEARVRVGLAADAGDETDGEDTDGDTDGDEAGDASEDGSDDEASGSQDPIATAWLDQFRRGTFGSQLLALPYADVDASAASHQDPELLAEARAASTEALSTLGITAGAVRASPNGYLNPDAIASAAPGETVLLSSDALGSEATSQADIGGHRVVVGSSAAVQGGPGPDDPLTETALRQRILSEAAVRRLSGDGEPLVVTLPAAWNPTDAREFWTGFDASWLRLRPLEDLSTALDPPGLELDELDYSDYQRNRELPEENFRATRELLRTAAVVQEVLPDDSVLEEAVRSEAFADVSYWSRNHRFEAQASAMRSTAAIRDLLDGLSLEAPPSLTLSGDSGRFNVGIHNDLDVPVTVGMAVEPGSQVDVEGMETKTVPAGDTSVVRLNASTEALGVHNVTLYLTTPSGVRLPVELTLPVRSSQVSEVIWLVMGGGALILAAAIVLRLGRRFARRRRPTDGDPYDDEADRRADEAKGAASPAEADA